MQRRTNLSADRHVDDIFIATSDEPNHLKILIPACERLAEHGVALIYNKCEFGAPKIPSLGHEIDKNGIKPTPEKVNLLDFPKPVTRQELQRFLAW